MRAVILAGGKGTRLKPYSTTIPKPIVPVGNMAIMEIIVRQLSAFGVDEITVAVNHMAQLIMAFFGDGSKWNVKINYSIEETPLSTIGPLKLLKDLPDHFLVLNGDILTDLNFAEFFQTHIDSGALGTIATFERDVKIDFGVLKYNGDNKRVFEFSEKPIEHFFVSMGIYALSRDLLAYVPDAVPFGFDDLMKLVIEKRLDVRAFPFRGYWLDIGRPDDYDRANEEFESVADRLLPSGTET
jgi:NDP-mannose synthase